MTDTDVLVIGGGLGGLVAAITSAIRGFRVELVESRSELGGPAGTQLIDGIGRVPILWHEFGRGLPSVLSTLGVRVEWQERRTQLEFDWGRAMMPADVRTSLRLSRHTLRLARLLKRAKSGNYDRLSVLLSAASNDAAFLDLGAAASYVLGVAPSAMPLTLLASGFDPQLAYGYDHAVVPVGGVQELVDGLGSRLVTLGGRIKTGVEVTGIERTTAGYCATIDGRELTTNHVISSVGRWGQWPAEAPVGLALHTLYVKVRGLDFWPKGTHTVAAFPENLAAWLDDLERGVSARSPAVHAYPVAASDVVVIHRFCARGQEDHFPPEQQQQVLDVLQSQLPRIGTQVLDSVAVSAGDFRARHGQLPCIQPRVPPVGMALPEIEDELGILHIGASVAPAGGHAGAEVLGGYRAAQLLPL